MSANIHDAIEVCLEAIQTGVELDRCLALYPDLIDDLRPALESALFAQMMSPSPPLRDSQVKSRTRLLGRAADLRTTRPPRSTWGFSRLALAGLTAIFVIVVAAGSLISVSAQSLPGDVLYPAKQASEKFNLSVAANALKQRELTERYLDRRIDEIQQLFAKGRIEEVKFQGNLTSIEDGRWIVDDIVVLILDDLDIPDELSLGVKLEIIGTVQPEGWVEAERVIVKVYKLDGLVMRIGADTWLIGDKEISITDLSLIENGVQVGDKVLVLVNVEDNEQESALAIIKGIRVEGDHDNLGSRSDEDSSYDEFDEDDALEEHGEEDPEGDSSDEDDGDEADEEGQEEDEEDEEEEEEDSDDDPSD